jgi:hypothetical protein
MTTGIPDSLAHVTQADLTGVVRELIGEVGRLRAENEKLSGGNPVEVLKCGDRSRRLRAVDHIRAEISSSGIEGELDVRNPATHTSVDGGFALRKKSRAIAFTPSSARVRRAKSAVAPGKRGS